MERLRAGADAVKARFERVVADLRPIGGARRAISDEQGERDDVGQASTSEVELLSRPRYFDRRHVVAVALLALCGLLGTWWWLGRSSETVVPVAAAPRTTGASPAQVPSPRASARADETPASTRGLFVHVVGAVDRPGVVELPAGARVKAAIEAAGGLLPDADPALLNLAAPVSDGSQIVVGTKTSPKGEIVSAPGADTVPGGAASGALVNLNAATAEVLQTLPGVGPATAQAILGWRKANGRFTRVEELLEVDGIGPKTLAKLSSLVTV